MPGERFHPLNNQGVESDAGYRLQRVNRFHYEFVDGETRHELIVEPGTVEEIHVPASLDGDARKKIGAALRALGGRFKLI